MANSVVPDQTAPIGAVCSGSTLFASILNSSVMLGNYLQQTTSADDIFRCIFFLGALRVNQICMGIMLGYEELFSFGDLDLIFKITAFLINFATIDSLLGAETSVLDNTAYATDYYLDVLYQVMKSSLVLH